MLDLFAKYGIRATFATVGFVFFSSKSELMASLPARLPRYRRPELSPYGAVLDSIGASEREDPYHFGADLVRRILETPGQEIATHTFSHYYCLEEGQEPDDFDADLKAASAAAGRWNVPLKSIVFPRNQYGTEYLRICQQNGIRVYRGNESHWIYAPSSRSEQSPLRRILRLVDSYINVTGHHVYASPRMSHSTNEFVNLPASRFLRPWSPRLRALERLRRRRIEDSMTVAARQGKVFHLWWHPHNFGLHTDENLAFLERILEHYAKLRHEYGFESAAMGDWVLEGR
jgi:peptidoglycan/xylan/chitin deacetylase (PgdA/CDA1 family)